MLILFSPFKKRLRNLAKKNLVRGESVHNDIMSYDRLAPIVSFAGPEIHVGYKPWAQDAFRSAEIKVDYESRLVSVLDIRKTVARYILIFSR